MCIMVVILCWNVYVLWKFVDRFELCLWHNACILQYECASYVVTLAETVSCHIFYCGKKSVVMCVCEHFIIYGDTAVTKLWFLYYALHH